ncbi:hypothetical protein [Mesorhizobium sp. M1423]|uniref:hypothetical protein n=1 Tax=Mesorhizobium sp. M1423 TaxID=2957101 RepID=UPI0033360305
MGSLGVPLTSLHRNVARYLFLDTHLYLSNDFAFHALALDEHRKQFDVLDSHCGQCSSRGSSVAYVGTGRTALVRGCTRKRWRWLSKRYSRPSAAEVANG